MLRSTAGGEGGQGWAEIKGGARMAVQTHKGNDTQTEQQAKRRTRQRQEHAGWQQQAERKRHTQVNRAGSREQWGHWRGGGGEADVRGAGEAAATEGNLAQGKRHIANRSECAEGGRGPLGAAYEWTWIWMNVDMNERGYEWLWICMNVDMNEWDMNEYG